MIAVFVVTLWGLVALVVLGIKIKLAAQDKAKIADLQRAEEIHTNAEKSRSDPLPSDVDAGLHSFGKLRD